MRDAARPGNAAVGWAALVPALLAYILARVVANVSLEATALYAAGLAALYLQVGRAGMRRAAFPPVYLALAIPLSADLVAWSTTGLRLLITDSAVRSLDAAGLMVAGEGLDIYVDGYRIAVAEACSGINSMISLTAIGLFYVHARGRRLGPVSLPAVLASILACAAAGNFARVLFIVLLTHWGGEAVVQGPLHELAGLVTFAVSLAGVMLLDTLVYARLPRRGVRVSDAPTRRTAMLGGAALLAGVTGAAMTPRRYDADAVRMPLARLVPTTLGSWRSSAGGDIVLPELTPPSTT